MIMMNAVVKPLSPFTDPGPQYWWREPSALLNEKNWRQIALDGEFALQAIDDSNVAAVDVLRVSRTGAVIDNIALSATAITLQGIAAVSSVVRFDEIANPGFAPANKIELHAEDDAGITRVFYQNDHARWVINQDNYVVARNVTGSTVAKMRAVRVVGGSGTRPTLGLANASTNLPAGGVTAASVANNGFVEVLTVGVLTGVNTSAWAEGTPLYVGDAGVLTSTIPASPALAQQIGSVLDQHAVNGSIYITRQQNTRTALSQNEIVTGDWVFHDLLTVLGPGVGNNPATINVTAEDWGTASVNLMSVDDMATITLDGKWEASLDLMCQDGFSSLRLKGMGAYIEMWDDDATPANSGLWRLSTSSQYLFLTPYTDAMGLSGHALQFTRSGNLLTAIDFGNTASNAPVTFRGTGMVTMGGDLTVTGNIYEGGSSLAAKYGRIASTNSWTGQNNFNNYYNTFNSTGNFSGIIIVGNSAAVTKAQKIGFVNSVTAPNTVDLMLSDDGTKFGLISNIGGVPTWCLSANPTTHVVDFPVTPTVAGVAIGSSVDAVTLGGYGLTVGGDRWGVIPFVGVDGLMEVGKYIDFHETDADVGDYSLRIHVTPGAMNIGVASFDCGSIYVRGSGLQLRLYETDAVDGADYGLLQVDANEVGIFGWDNSAGAYRQMFLGNISTGALRIGYAGFALGFYGATAVTKPTVSGAKGGNAALTSLLTALAGMGLITDSSS